MKLTLRKANAVQAAINEAIKGLDLSTSVTLNEFEDVQEQISNVRERFWKNAAIRNSLVTALYEIREKVSAANAASGIDSMLASVALFEKQIGHNNQLASKGAQTALRVLKGQIQKVAEAKDEGYGYSRRDVVTSIFTEEEVEKFRNNALKFKREKQRLQDTLLEMNVRTEIELTQETVDVLAETGIL